MDIGQLDRDGLGAHGVDPRGAIAADEPEPRGDPLAGPAGQPLSQDSRWGKESVRLLRTPIMNMSPSTGFSATS